MMSLLDSEEKECKLIPQQKKEMNSKDLVCKSVDSIHQELANLFADSSSRIEDFQSREFVQRAVNNVSFMANKSEICPTKFERAAGTVLHVCLSRVCW